MGKTLENISGNIVDIVSRDIYPGTIKIRAGKIARIIPEGGTCEHYIIPGFIDSHIHIESSMLTPSEFARIAVAHGTVGAVCDPHEIANVMGYEGVEYMVKEGRSIPFKFYWSAPSCVPATTFETAGASLGVDQIARLLKMEEVKCLGEVMNFPGVIQGDQEILMKIKKARDSGKVIDGHAPGLSGEGLVKYVEAGISTDHECTSRIEALEKIRLGMKVQIREGSAAKNFDELIPIAREHPHSCMFCTDDKHPDDLKIGHINRMVKRALDYGIDKFDALRIASFNPISHYDLQTGCLQAGDPADFLIVDNLKELNILKVFIDGSIVEENGESLIGRSRSRIVNNFATRERHISDFAVKDQGGNINIIQAIDGQLVTNRLSGRPKDAGGYLISDPARDLVKISVVNRYVDALPAVGFIKNFGIKKGAIASSVAHDSHNILCAGVEDSDICKAVNEVIKNKGGICAVCGEEIKALALPIGGIISNLDYKEVARIYTELDEYAKELGSYLRAPFMTLSFMALLVIPHIKLSDKGLFDVSGFKFMDLFTRQ